MEAGNYVLMVEHLSGPMGRIDFVEFEPTTPVEAATWGRIKNMYR
mgnify:CR=1 FL=1